MSRIKAIVPFLLAAGLCACGQQEEALRSEDLPAPEQANYETVEVEEGEYIRTAGGSLQLYYPITADLCWEEGNARFREILVSKGQEVKEGDCLATFDIEESRTDREELSLSLTRKTEEARIGREDRLRAIEEAREETEEKRKDLTEYELQIEMLKIQRLETEYEQFVYQSEWEIARLKERLEELEEVVADDALYAPFDGMIDSVASYNPGDLVTPDRVVVAMHATDKYYLVADDSSGKLRYNMEVTVEAGRRNEKTMYQGRVVAAPAILPSSVRRGMALIELYEDVSPEDLKGSLQFQYNLEELQDVLLVDWKALDSEQGKSFVYVLEDDMVQKRYVVPGMNNREKAWILDGLSEGQTVIAD